ncbi:hypothetical protein A3K63_00510 [Candidatus Micrarchaeota archaeon RBG_16_49_10]|nr:MAG: hypothetical protein A3K63_00510 [Candidatus Micrarchaeota archaeon RBG_16_49_10]
MKLGEEMDTKMAYFKHFGWSSNPFTLNIMPEMMVGYSSQTESLLSHVFNEHKIAVVIGHTGSGKTTLLNWLNNKFNQEKSFRSFYIPKPPKEKENLILVFKSLLGFNFLDKLQMNSIDINNLPKFIAKKTRSIRAVFLVDEAHECSVEVLEWLRTLTDVVPNMSIIFAGLPIFKEKLEIELPTLSMRITTEIYLQSLDASETESLIMKRIESVGGKGISPFNSEAVYRIFEITGGFPREIIKKCDFLIAETAKRNLNSINKGLLDTVFSSIPSQKTIKNISSLNIPLKQMNILRILDKNPNLNPTQIVELLGQEDYKNKSNAVRSVNNILKRLMDEGLIGRKREGKNFVYLPSGKAKSLLAEA